MIRRAAARGAAAPFAQLTLLALALAMPRPALAHGIYDRPVWNNHPLGPYRVTLWADLHVPASELYARVRLADGSPAPEGTSLRFLATGPAGVERGAEAERLLLRAGEEGDFDAFLPTPESGRWDVTVRLDGPAGAAEQDFARNAIAESEEQWARSPFLWATLVVIGLTGIGLWRWQGASGETEG